MLATQVSPFEDNWLLAHLRPLVGDAPFYPLRRTGTFPRTIYERATAKKPDESGDESWTLDVVALDSKTLPPPIYKALHKVCFDNYIAFMLSIPDDENREATREALFARFADGDLLRLLGLRRVTATGEAVVSIVGHTFLEDVWSSEPREVLGQTRQYGIWFKQAMLHPRYHQAHIARDTIHEAILEKHPSFLCGRTQNPSILSLFASLRWETEEQTAKSVLVEHPVPTAAPSVVLPLAYLNASSGRPEMPGHVRDFCLDVMSSASGLKQNVPSYDPETMVLKKVFPPTLLGPVPKGHPLWQVISGFMNPAAGDALFSIALPAAKAKPQTPDGEHNIIVSRL